MPSTGRSRSPRTMYSSRRKQGSVATTTRNPTILPKVKRWDGQSRTSSPWDGLRRDLELWLPHGDCWVHLYAKGQSRRGPAFCVPVEALNVAHCGGLFSMLHAQTKVDNLMNAKWELYVPAPEKMSRDEAFDYHITTRNVFAFLFGKPLVGVKLGKTLVDLQNRLAEYRDEDVDNLDEMTGYCETMGYLDFGHNPDFALASLLYAEQFKIRDLWIDAFAHCVGMDQELILSEEFGPIPEPTKALMTKSYLEMEVHLNRVTRATGNFLEDELSSTRVGLSEGARDHLDRFRIFLHSFYMERHGYWPPAKDFEFNKELYTAMYFDFQGLYDYLADQECDETSAALKMASGGICVLQNIKSFDIRERFPHLPHLMPLLPDKPLREPQSRRRSLATFKLNNPEARAEESLANWKLLVSATNSRNLENLKNPLVRAYMRFEKECCYRVDESVSSADARKVRWLLTYGMLQMLVYAVRAPSEVRQTSNISYPLCCMTASAMPWQSGFKNKTETLSVSDKSSLKSLTQSGTTLSRVDEIRPDCDLDEHESSTTSSTADSTSSAPLPVAMLTPVRSSSSTGLSRHGSFSLSKRLSLGSYRGHRRSGFQPESVSSQLNEMLAHTQAEKIDKTVSATSAKVTEGRESSIEPLQTASQSSEAAEIPSRTPLLSALQVSPMIRDHALDALSLESPALSNISIVPSPVFSSFSTTSDSTMTSPASSIHSKRRHSISSLAECSKPMGPTLSPVQQSPTQPTSFGETERALEHRRKHSGSSSVDGAHSITDTKSPSPKRVTFDSRLSGEVLEDAPRESDAGEAVSAYDLTYEEPCVVTTALEEDLPSAYECAAATNRTLEDGSRTSMLVTSSTLSDAERAILEKLNIKPSGLFNVRVPLGPADAPLDAETHRVASPSQSELGSLEFSPGTKPTRPSLDNHDEETEAAASVKPDSSDYPRDWASHASFFRHNEDQNFEPSLFSLDGDAGRKQSVATVASSVPTVILERPASQDDDEEPKMSATLFSPVVDRPQLSLQTARSSSPEPEPSLLTPPVPSRRRPIPLSLGSSKTAEEKEIQQMSREQRRQTQIAQYQAMMSNSKLRSPTSPTFSDVSPPASPRFDHSTLRTSSSSPHLSPSGGRFVPMSAPPTITEFDESISAHFGNTTVISSPMSAYFPDIIDEANAAPPPFIGRQSKKKNAFASATNSFSKKSSSVGKSEGKSVSKELDAFKKRFRFGSSRS